MLFFPKKAPLRVSLDWNVTIYLYYWQGKQKQDKYYFTTHLQHACNISTPRNKKIVFPQFPDSRQGDHSLGNIRELRKTGNMPFHLYSWDYYVSNI